MTKYCIVAARPKNASNHLNSQFRMYRWDTTERLYKSLGWKTIGEVSQLMQAGHEVITGRENDTTITSGAAVEIELRIAKNDTQFKISTMPDS